MSATRFSLKSLIGGTRSPSPSNDPEGKSEGDGGRGKGASDPARYKNPASAEIARVLRAQVDRLKLWEPQTRTDGTPHPQEIALASPATIICYGGQAGGGKSDFAIGTPLREHRATTIFRRQNVQLSDLVRRAKTLTEGFRTGFNGQSLMLTLPGGSFLEFGGLNDPDDWMKWKGRRRDCWVFDEATEFLRGQIFSLIGWLGSAVPGQRLRMILTFNPPTTPEGEWINELLAPWIDQEDPQKPPHPFAAGDGEVRYFVQVGDPQRPDSNRIQWVESAEAVEMEMPGGQVETLYPMSITFVRASVRDNKYLASDDDYIRSLMSLPEPLRSQALHGRWNASQAADPWQVLPTAWVLAAQARWRESGRENPLSALGCDIAHGGSDRTAIAPRHANWIDRLRVYEGRETPDGNAAAEKIYSTWDSAEQGSGTDFDALANIDALGYGANCLVRLASPPPAGFGLRRVQSILGQQKSDYVPPMPGTNKPGKLRCRNLRAEGYWRLRLALDPDQPGGSDFALPPGAELLRDLCAARYKVPHGGTADGGLIQIEEKDEIKKRLGRSPDLADCCALSMLPLVRKVEEHAAAPTDFSASFTRSGGLSGNRSGAGNQPRPAPTSRPRW